MELDPVRAAVAVGPAALLPGDEPALLELGEDPLDGSLRHQALVGEAFLPDEGGPLCVGVVGEGGEDEPTGRVRDRDLPRPGDGVDTHRSAAPRDRLLSFVATGAGSSWSRTAHPSPGWASFVFRLGPVGGGSVSRGHRFAMALRSLGSVLPSNCYWARERRPPHAPR